MIFKIRAGILPIFVLLSASVTLIFFYPPLLSAAAETDVDGPRQPVFDLETEPFYENAEQTLQRLAEHKASLKKNNFCVVGYKHGEETHAYVYWKESNKLILWEPSIGGGKQKLWLSRRYLDLKQDVVPAKNDLHGSTHLLTQNWVDSLLSDCSKRGRNFLIVVKKIKCKKKQ